MRYRSNWPELPVVFLFFGGFSGCHGIFTMSDVYGHILTSWSTDSTQVRLRENSVPHFRYKFLSWLVISKCDRFNWHEVSLNYLIDIALVTKWVWWPSVMEAAARTDIMRAGPLQGRGISPRMRVVSWYLQGATLWSLVATKAVILIAYVILLLKIVNSIYTWVKRMLWINFFLNLSINPWSRKQIGKQLKMSSNPKWCHHISEIRRN